ncbi:hypothetical protein GCM10011513_36940 [Franconibacter daqui]|nr:hypothetical protein GCM10011513_36940 [Franconibacter daqui]
MNWYINTPVTYHHDKKYITPRHLFTNTWREGFYIKAHSNGYYDLNKTYHWSTNNYYKG